MIFSIFTKLCTHRHYQFQDVLTILEGNRISTSSYSPSPAPQPQEPLECFGFRFGGSQVPSAGGWAAAGMLSWPRPAEASLGRRLWDSGHWPAHLAGAPEERQDRTPTTCQALGKRRRRQGTESLQDCRHSRDARECGGLRGADAAGT